MTLLKWRNGKRCGLLVPFIVLGVRKFNGVIGEVRIRWTARQLIDEGECLVMSQDREDDGR